MNTEHNKGTLSKVLLAVVTFLVFSTCFIGLQEILPNVNNVLFDMFIGLGAIVTAAAMTVLLVGVPIAVFVGIGLYAAVQDGVTFQFKQE